MFGFHCDRGEDRHDLRRNRSAREKEPNRTDKLPIGMVVQGGLAMYPLPGRGLAQTARGLNPGLD